MSIRIVVGDDDGGFRAAVIEVLEADPRFAVVGEAVDGAELLEVTAATDPDLVLLDVRMASGGTIAARALTALEKESGRSGVRPLVVALTAEASPEVVASMLEAGAVGYLAKGRLGATLPDLLARVVEGEVVLAVPSGINALRHLLGHRRGSAGSTATNGSS